MERRFGKIYFSPEFRVYASPDKKAEVIGAIKASGGEVISGPKQHVKDFTPLLEQQLAEHRARVAVMLEAATNHPTQQVKVEIRKSYRELLELVGCSYEKRRLPIDDNFEPAQVASVLRNLLLRGYDGEPSFRTGVTKGVPHVRYPEEVVSMIETRVFIAVLGLDGKKQTFDEIASELGIKPYKARRIFERARYALRSWSNALLFDQFRIGAGALQSISPLPPDSNVSSKKGEDENSVRGIEEREGWLFDDDDDLFDDDDDL